MASLRDIRRKIKSVKSNQKITRAMKMVAAARMRRAQSSILSSRPFAVKMEQAVRELSLLEVAADIEAEREIQIHSFFDVKREGPECLVLVSGDKGLCGAFNANTMRLAIEWLRKRQGKKVIVAAVGRKAREFIHRLRDFEIEVIIELAGIFPKVNFAHGEMLGKAVIEAYEKKGCVSVDVVYNGFKSVAVQRAVEARLLPIPIPEAAAETAVSMKKNEFKFEPEREALLNALLPRYIKAQLYRILLESQAAELAARMNAMDAASKNAGELIGIMTLDYNRTRQAIITREIAELVGGAEALAN